MSYLEKLKRIGRAGESLPDILNDEEIIAVLIDCTVLNATIWLAVRGDFKPDAADVRAVFYAHELPFLKGKTPEQLREIHKIKVTYGPGYRVRQ